MNTVELHFINDEEVQWLKDVGFITHEHPSLPDQIEYEFNYWDADPSVGVDEEFEVHSLTYLGETKHPNVPRWLQTRIEKDIQNLDA